MPNESISTPEAAAAEVSLIRGGPFFRAQLALRLIAPDKWNFTRRIFVVIASIGWLPLVVLTVVLNPEGFASFLREYRVHARLLLAVPALLIGESFMESRFRLVMQHIRRAGLLDPSDLAYMGGEIATLIRIRDAWLPELAVFALLVLHTALSYRGLVDATPWLGLRLRCRLPSHRRGLVRSTGQRACYFSSSLGLALWKWLLWTYFAFKLSRRNLNVVATHPDGHGGLGFLGLTAVAFAPIAFAVTAVIVRHMAIRNPSSRHASFGLQDCCASIARDHRDICARAFSFFRAAARHTSPQRHPGVRHARPASLRAVPRKKWIAHRIGHESEFLQAPESVTLNNFSQSYQRIVQLKPFPADVGSLYGLAAAVAIPALPVVLAQIPLAVVVMDLLKTLR